VGLNGTGKTNILDAIHYLSNTKSAFNAIDAQNIRHEMDYFVLNGVVKKKDKPFDIHCSLKRKEKKLFKVDECEYDRLSQHVGKFPIVLIAPNDDELIRDSNETRRKFFDSIICQSDNDYLQDLIQYNHLLKQRNALLKMYADSGNIDKVLLDTYRVPMVKASLSIAKKRSVFINSFLPHFSNLYNKLADHRDVVDIGYSSKALDDSFDDAFKSSLEKDLITQRTNLGIHRDEYQFKINTYPIKKFGSQGQQKSLLISLKLAQYEFIQSKLGIKPILLLDDIFDKLDDLRIQKLMDIIVSDQFGQLFITDAREERTRTLLLGKYEPLKVFRVEDNAIEEMDE
jgi:DNA replication and repair protein RecF